jgi:branched-subunit amino acid aminotransferase/4-amino-4-deoxychorismate lyase
LPGITREAVLEFPLANGTVASEASVTPDELRAADEVFVTNSVAGVLPVTTIDGLAIGDGQPGTVTRALGAELRRAIVQSPRFTRSGDSPGRS